MNKDTKILKVIFLVVGAIACWCVLSFAGGYECDLLSTGQFIFRETVSLTLVFISIVVYKLMSATERERRRKRWHKRNNIMTDT